MKTIILSVFAILIISHIHAQDYDGYYITKAGDTIRGKVQVPKGNIQIVGPTSVSMGRATHKGTDFLKNETSDESKKINYSKLSLNIKFSEGDDKFKRIDCFKVRGFGFTYEDRPYDFISWDVTANKQLYSIPATGEIDPNGDYFVLRSVHGAWPVYSLFQDIQLVTQRWNNGSTPDMQTNPINPDMTEINTGKAAIRDIIFEHPTKGLILIQFKYPPRMKFDKILEYLELEDEFINTLNKKDTLLDVVLKYNLWKEKK